jgi:hypothetical protein
LVSNVVFVLGAGASKAAGAPLMGDFLDTAYRLWKEGKVAERDDDFARVFGAISALQSVHSKSRLDLDNVESVFSTFEMAAMLSRLPGREPDEIEAALESLKVLIGTTIEMTLEIPWHKGHAYAPVPYVQFVELLKQVSRATSPRRSVSVVTFNYDLACDFAMHSAGLGVDYALDDATDRNTIPLLKLHGSLNWVYCPDLERVVPWTLQEHFGKYRWDVWDEQTIVRLRLMPHLKDFKYQEHDVLPEPVLVPPTWNKSTYHRNIAEVWKRAARELSDAEDIYIIGYSLPETDSFFRYLYALGTVGETMLKRLWVFNPDQTVEDRFESMLGPAAQARFRFVPETFSGAIRLLDKDYPAER